MRRSLIALALLVLTATPVIAETVRGKVVHPDGKTAYASVSVTLTAGGKSGTAYTGGDGMFYLQNVTPGQYTLTLKSPKESKKVQIVVQPKPYTDVAPVTMQ